MKHIAIYGAGGFGKETKYLIETINLSRPEFAFEGFIDDACERDPVAKPGTFDSLSIAVAFSLPRKRIYLKCGDRFDYPALIHPQVLVDKSVVHGKGLIVCAGVQLTVDISIDDFVILNLNATVGHDVSIGAFSSIMPGAGISGNVKIGEGVFVGTGAVILQGLVIGNNATIGAGAVVTRDVPPGAVAKGVPARWS